MAAVPRGKAPNYEAQRSVAMRGVIGYHLQTGRASYVLLLLLLLHVCIQNSAARQASHSNLPSAGRSAISNDGKSASPLASGRKAEVSPRDGSHSSCGGKDVLVLDVDGTMYPFSAGVEQQVIKGISAWTNGKFSLSVEDCDVLHRAYGSVVEGLKKEGRLTTFAELADFYETAYRDIDLSGLYQHGATTEGGGDRTGYRHKAGQWAKFLEELPNPKYLASNSPSWHVERVVAALGLAHVKWSGILCPDTSGGITKSSPQFYEPILIKHSIRKDDKEGEGVDIYLLDDSAVNLQVAGGLGMKSIRVQDKDFPLEQALAAFIGAIPPPSIKRFSDIGYLKAKNVVDKKSRNIQVWERLKLEVSLMDFKGKDWSSGGGGGAGGGGDDDDDHDDHDFFKKDRNSDDGKEKKEKKEKEEEGNEEGILPYGSDGADTFTVRVGRGGGDAGESNLGVEGEGGNEGSEGSDGGGERGVRRRGTLRVLDVGAGLLSMLEPVCTLRGDFDSIEYTAFETEEPIVQEAVAVLLQKGFSLLNEPFHHNRRDGHNDDEDNRDYDDEHDVPTACVSDVTVVAAGGRGKGGSCYRTFWKAGDKNAGDPDVTVTLRQDSFLTASADGLFPTCSSQHKFSPSSSSSSVAHHSHDMRHESNHHHHHDDHHHCGHPERSDKKDFQQQHHHDQHRRHHHHQDRLYPHVIIGCCLADLFAPPSLISTLCRLAGETGCLLYLPITFAGKTVFEPEAGFVRTDHASKAEETLTSTSPSTSTSTGEPSSLSLSSSSLSPPSRSWDPVRSPSEEVNIIPSDKMVIDFYHRGLAEYEGHNLEPQRIIDAITAYGGKIITQGPSDWVVEHSNHPVLWDSLLYFFGMGVTPQLGQRWDLRGWTKRARALRPTLRVSNVDLLARLYRRPSGKAPDTWTQSKNRLSNRPHDDDAAVTTSAQAAAVLEVSGKTVHAEDIKDTAVTQLRGGGGSSLDGRGGGGGGGAPHAWTNRYLEFVSPRVVRVGEEFLTNDIVGPGQLVVETICSSISSGTELKMFRGEFARGSQLDTSIKAMEDDVMSYPLRYGYSLVGKVIYCGSAVEDPEAYLGKNVFVFSSHASLAIVDAAGAMVIPEGIAPEDAIYLPAVETALSMVHDANPRVGEHVGIIGQGMIGLLITAILARTHAGPAGGTVTAVDAIASRRDVAASVGATQAIAPAALGIGAGGGEEDEKRRGEEGGDEGVRDGFDVTVEVSGNFRGLQSALDNTAFGGRVILGSWYGDAPAQLTLGTKFHRSHLSLIASQTRFRSQHVRHKRMKEWLMAGWW